MKKNIEVTNNSAESATIEYDVIDFTYDQYTGFIQSVVNAVIKSGGMEYLRFWETLIFKMIFMEYKPQHILENGSIDMNAEWEEIKDFDIWAVNLASSNNFMSNALVEMEDIIKHKLNVYFDKSDLERSLIGLVNKATDYVDSLSAKLAETDINKSVEEITALNEKLGGLDAGVISDILAKHAIEVNEKNKDE